MGEPAEAVKIQDEVIEVPDDKEEGVDDDVHAEVCIHPGRHREDSGFSTNGEGDVQQRLSELEDKLYRRCFDKVVFSMHKQAPEYISFFFLNFVLL